MHHNFNQYDKRTILFPIQRPRIWQYYKTLEQTRWDAEEVAFKDDATHYETKLTSAEQRMVDYIFGVFAQFDQLVLDIVGDFKIEIPVIEVDFAYTEKESQERTHVETYHQQIMDTIVDDGRREQILNSTAQILEIQQMAGWLHHGVKNYSLPYRMVMSICVEGIFFTSQFCVIYWFNDRGLLPGTSHANELIARDENTHVELDIAILHDTGLIHNLEQSEVHRIIDECVQLNDRMNEAMITQDQPDMNIKLLNQHTRYTADHYLQQLGFGALYGVGTPFDFMKKLSLSMKTNFFECRVSDYNKIEHPGDNELKEDEF